MEIWKDIFFIGDGVEHDYRDLYQISNEGYVKSFRNGKERILKAVKNTDGYFQVSLYKNGKVKNFLVHRLVAFHFLDGYFEGAVINHKDENPSNNHFSNLEWCTVEYNVNYGTRNKKAGESNKGSLIARCSLDGNLIDIKYQFEYVQMGFNKSHISSCCKGKRKTHKGFIFKYWGEG